MQHALTSTSTVKNMNAYRAHTAQLQDFNCTCDHSHTASCEECNQLHRLHEQFSAHVDEAIAKRLSEAEFVVGEDAKAMAMQQAQNTGEVWREHITMLHDEASRWVGHIVRKHAASRAPPELKSQLKLGEVFLTIDYKCKPLSRKNREPQSENFGKRGKSLFGLSALFLKETMEEYLQQPGGEQPDFEVMGDYAVMHVRVCCDDASQDWWHSTQVFTTALLLLKAKCPFLKQGSLYSDGAGNFKGLAFTAMLPQISARTGIRIKHHVLPEAGDGKDDCDRDFNGCNILFASYVKVDGRSMTNANEICEALERGKGRGVINCALAVSKAAVAAPEFKPDTSKFTKLVGKSKTNLFHTKFEYKEDGSFSGFRFWVAFGFGEGKFVTAAQLGTCLAGTRPDLSTFKPIITYGTTLDECTPVLVDELKY